MLREAGLSAASLTEPVEHLGYVRERAAERDKKERDQRLLRACVEEDPADLYSWFKLLELGRFWQDPAFSASVAEALAPRLAEHAEGLAELPQGAELVTLFAEARHPGDPAAALAESEAFPQAAPSPASLLALGGWLEALSRRDEARRAFERCLQGGDLSTRVSLARPLLGLARLALAEGDAAEAIRRSDQALGHAPRDPEALLGALSLRDDRDRAAFADAHRARHGDSDELAEAEGEAALLGGNALGAIAAYRRSGSPRAALKLAQALVLAGEGDRAREVLAASALPEAGVGLLVCDILDRKASKLEVDLTQNEADVALLDWLRCLQRRPDLLASFLEAAPALLGVFPWLTQLL